MFTGIIVEMGTVKEVTKSGSSLYLEVFARKVVAGLNVGDSVSVNGVCLTAVKVGREGFGADVMPETYERTNLKELARGSKVNLEPSLKMGDPLGGHLVCGHVDAICTISRIQREENALAIQFDCPPELLRYIVPKGSVALDGVSLTVVDRSRHGFAVSLIPHTARSTTLGLKDVGDRVNLEVDILGKYVESFLRAWSGLDRNGDVDHSFGHTKEMSLEFLKEHGFVE